MIGKFVYDNIYVYYTMKQWGKKPEEIDPAVTARVPVNISYDNCYFGDKYQGVPLHGFTPMFEKMVEHENITIELGVEAKEVLGIEDGKVLYRGQVLTVMSSLPVRLMSSSIANTEDFHIAPWILYLSIMNRMIFKDIRL